MKDKETTIGHLLLESLTKDQIACMLKVVASAWDLKILMDEFMRADPDTGERLIMGSLFMTFAGPSKPTC